MFIIIRNRNAGRDGHRADEALGPESGDSSSGLLGGFNPQFLHLRKGWKADYKQLVKEVSCHVQLSVTGRCLPGTAGMTERHTRGMIKH